MNALTELQNLLSRTKSEIKAATVSFGHGYYEEDEQPPFNLKVSHSTDDLKAFEEYLNRNYDNGYGGQELHGIIWFEDGTWAERGEYDGSEWWEHRKLPAIPKELL